MFKKTKLPNRRHYPRIPLVAPVRFAKDGTDQKKEEGVIRSLSTHGIGMYTKASLKKGDRLLIHLSLLTDQNHPVTESLSGEVTWAAAEGDKGRYSVGVCVDRMEKDHPALFAYVKRLEEAVLLPDGDWKNE